MLQKTAAAAATAADDDDHDDLSASAVQIRAVRPAAYAAGLDFVAAAAAAAAPVSASVAVPALAAAFPCDVQQMHSNPVTASLDQAGSE